MYDFDSKKFFNKFGQFYTTGFNPIHETVGGIIQNDNRTKNGFWQL